MGGIGGCLEMMDSITNCTADVTITSVKGGHAIGGLCGYAGTHSNGAGRGRERRRRSLPSTPAVIENCTVNVKIDAPEATHVVRSGGHRPRRLTAEQTAFAVSNCTVNGEISAATPGALAGRAEGCTYENCTLNVTMRTARLCLKFGTTDRMYESADQ